jgi:hypothetical protein
MIDRDVGPQLVQGAIAQSEYADQAVNIADRPCDYDGRVRAVQNLSVSNEG